MPLQESSSAQDAKANQSSPLPTRAIFREEALQHYRQNQEKVALPPTISPKAFLVLWVMATLILMTGLVLVFWPTITQLGIQMGIFAT